MTSILDGYVKQRGGDLRPTWIEADRKCPKLSHCTPCFEKPLPKPQGLEFTPDLFLTLGLLMDAPMLPHHVSEQTLMCENY